MAQKVLVQLTDDLDGSEATTTVTFTYKGDSFEIDLSDKNVARFDKVMEPFTGAARKPVKGAVRRSQKSKVVPAYDAAAVRLWATMNGHEVPARGRIPAGVLAAYEQANP